MCLDFDRESDPVEKIFYLDLEFLVGKDFGEKFKGLIDIFKKSPDVIKKSSLIFGSGRG